MKSVWVAALLCFLVASTAASAESSKSRRETPRDAVSAPSITDPLEGKEGSAEVPTICPRAGEVECVITGDTCYRNFKYCATPTQCDNAKCVATCPCENGSHSDKCIDDCSSGPVVASAVPSSAL